MRQVASGRAAAGLTAPDGGRLVMQSAAPCSWEADSGREGRTSAAAGKANLTCRVF